MTAGLRSLAFVLALTAMLLRGLIPAGWMPAPEGASGLVICTGHGLAHVPSPAEHQHPLPKQGEQLCAFASAAHLAPPALQFTTLPASIDGIAVTAEPNRGLLRTTSSFRQQFPRAPPDFA